MEWQARYFAPAELTVTATGLDNTPTDAEWGALHTLCVELLDPLRTRLGQPMVITSGFRSERVNHAVGGSSTSQHRHGQAVDFHLPGYDSLREAGRILAAAADLPYRQIIFYDPRRSTHIHIGYDGSANPRRQVLWANHGGGYEEFDLSRVRTYGK